MDEKRFLELFPEVQQEKDKRSTEEKEKQQAFFAHMKQQIKPQRVWQAAQAEDKKAYQRRQPVWMAYVTAAVCLLVVLLLPNISSFWGVSDEKLSDEQLPQTISAADDQNDENAAAARTRNRAKERMVSMYLCYTTQAGEILWYQLVDTSGEVVDKLELLGTACVFSSKTASAEDGEEVLVYGNKEDISYLLVQNQEVYDVYEHMES